VTKKLFMDSDIILDLLAQRPLFYDDAAKIFSWAYKKKMVYNIIRQKNKICLELLHEI
jgi:hypothetical protein